MIFKAAALYLTCVMYTTVMPCRKEFYVPYQGHENDYALDLTPNNSLTVGTAVECLRECSDVKCLAMNICPDTANPELINCGLFMETLEAKTFSSAAGCRYLELDKCPGPQNYDVSSGKCVCSPIWMIGINCDTYYKDCSAAYEDGLRDPTEHMTIEIKPSTTSSPFQIRCYLAWGGWNPVERRDSTCPDSLESLDWSGFRVGSGVTGNTCTFFLGLEKIHQITHSGVFNLDVYVVGEDGLDGHAYYNNFRLGNESTKYAVNWDSYKPNDHAPDAAEDGFEFGLPNQHFRGHGFATPDNADPNNCAVSEGTGWWYGQVCPSVNLHKPTGPTGLAVWPKGGSLKKIGTFTLQLQRTA